jgi:predicted PurR-regulated permease PerM
MLYNFFLFLAHAPWLLYYSLRDGEKDYQKAKKQVEEDYQSKRKQLGL